MFLKKTYCLLLGVVLSLFYVGLSFAQSNLLSQECLNLFNSQQYGMAFQKCKPLADTGDMSAQAVVGGMLMMGDGVQENIPLAIEYFKKAANQGHAQSAYAIGSLLTTGETLPPNYEEALPWIRQATLGGSPDARDLLSLYYLQGLGGLEADSEMAFMQMEIAADMGRPA